VFHPELVVQIALAVGDEAVGVFSEQSRQHRAAAVGGAPVSLMLFYMTSVTARLPSLDPASSAS
jgi:hypothetical protein